MTDEIRKQALDALDGMRQIVSREMLIKGQYVSDDFDPTQSTAICQGRRYCAIGSLWAGAGIRARKRGSDVALPGVEQGNNRARFLRTRPGLKFAYDAVNAAAERYIKRNKLAGEDLLDEWGERPFEAPLEALFESESLDIGRPELLKLIASAKRKVKAAA